jgi:hypothetical protein
VKAWLLTWECNTSSVKEKIVAVLCSRRSDQAVAGLMEFLVLRATSSAHSLAYYANRRKELVYRAQTPLAINRVPHGERILCGHDPWLYGRKVSALRVELDAASNEELVSWREPDDFRWTDGSERAIEVARAGIVKSLRRPNRALSADIDVEPQKFSRASSAVSRA